MANGEIRGGLSERIRRRLGSGGKSEKVLLFLQPRAAPPVARLQNAGRDLWPKDLEQKCLSGQGVNEKLWKCRDRGKLKDSFPQPLGKAKRRLFHIPTASAASDKFKNLRKKKGEKNGNSTTIFIP